MSTNRKTGSLIGTFFEPVLLSSSKSSTASRVALAFGVAPQGTESADSLGGGVDDDRIFG